MGRVKKQVAAKAKQSVDAKKPTVSKRADESIVTINSCAITTTTTATTTTNLPMGSVIDRVKSLEEYDDFEEKIRRSNLGSDKSDIDALIAEYIKFMQLRATTTQVSPSFLIDQVWHISLLFPVMYYQLCSLIRNHASDGEGNSVVVEGVDVLMNHFPLLGDNVSKQLNRYNNCVKLYEAEFGMTPPHKYWARAGSSSQGSSSSSLSPQSVVDMHKTQHLVLSQTSVLSPRSDTSHTPVTTSTKNSTVIVDDTSSNQCITIGLRLENGELTTFLINRSKTRIGVVFGLYASRKGISINGLRFLLDGEHISFDCHFTSDEMELKNGDEIGVYLEQEGC